MKKKWTGSMTSPLRTVSLEELEEGEEEPLI